jgi:polypeptide N-acetylgalactosaminyltransferase
VHALSGEENANQVPDPLQRQAIESENMDEFLAPVLAEYKYIEVDLNEKHSARHDDYDDEIVEDEKRVIPALGAGGEKAKVPEFQEAVAKEVMKKEAFNRLLSEMISVNRTVPDTREKTCQSIKYDQHLPDASVVIIYTNEAFSSLVR